MTWINERSGALRLTAACSDPKYAQYLLGFGWTNALGARTQPGLLEFMRVERERWNEIFKAVKFEPQ